MKKRILVLCLALCLLLTGCSTGDKKAADIPGRLTIGNVNALCQDAQLLESDPIYQEIYDSQMKKEVIA